jgi:hypothetical protein
MDLTFSTIFFGSVSDKHLDETINIQGDHEKVNLFTSEKTITMETKISVGDKELFFFFSIKDKIFRLRLYINGNMITGDIRKRIGHQDYELIYFIKHVGGNIKDNFHCSNLYFYENCWNEIQDK